MILPLVGKHTYGIKNILTHSVKPVNFSTTKLGATIDAYNFDPHFNKYLDFKPKQGLQGC